MRRIVMLAVACAFTPCVTAQAKQLSPSQTPIDLSNYTAELVQKPEYNQAYRTMAALPTWVSSGKGTSTPTTQQIINGQPYRIGHLCEPHNCAQNQFEVILSQNGKQAWGLFSSRIGKTLYQMPFGNPDETLLAALVAAYRANNPSDSQ